MVWIVWMVWNVFVHTCNYIFVCQLESRYVILKRLLICCFFWEIWSVETNAEWEVLIWTSMGFLLMGGFFSDMNAEFGAYWMFSEFGAWYSSGSVFFLFWALVVLCHHFNFLVFLSFRVSGMYMWINHASIPLCIGGMYMWINSWNRGISVLLSEMIDSKVNSRVELKSKWGNHCVFVLVFVANFARDRSYAISRKKAHFWNMVGSGQWM